MEDIEQVLDASIAISPPPAPTKKESYEDALAAERRRVYLDRKALRKRIRTANEEQTGEDMNSVSPAAAATAWFVGSNDQSECDVPVFEVMHRE